MMGKQVLIADTQAQRLEQLASVSGDTESALVEQALELLFRYTQAGELMRTDWELLRQMEAQTPPVTHRRTPALNPDAYQVTHAVLIAPESIRRRGEEG